MRLTHCYSHFYYRSWTGSIKLRLHCWFMSCLHAFIIPFFRRLWIWPFLMHISLFYIVLFHLSIHIILVIEHLILLLNTGCNAPPFIANGSFDASSGTSVNSLAYLKCDPGYLVAGDDHIKCLAGGSWTLPSGNCTPKGLLYIRLSRNELSI